MEQVLTTLLDFFLFTPNSSPVSKHLVTVETKIAFEQSEALEQNRTQWIGQKICTIGANVNELASRPTSFHMR